MTRPEIYYGESDSGYAVVLTDSQEFDYPSGDENVYTTYEGHGGVLIGTIWRRMLFAMYFKELKILLSGDFTGESRIMLRRDIRERLAKIAPFVRYDPDPYLIIRRDGGLVWMVDGYTISHRYPYSMHMAGLGSYIRNAVKVTVDAYTGEVRFYATDGADPILRTYAAIFPGVFRSFDEMPEDLRAHIRYPQTLFQIQARMYATYHMTDPQVFYNKEDLWAIPIRSTGSTRAAMEPYYTMMKVASEGRGEREEFILMIPFTPAKKKNMIAWMAARCDDPHYGKLLVYNFPKQKLVYGPQQIDNRIDQEPTISEQLSLWDQTGSRVIRGSLLVIPVEDSVLYVQPLYLEAQGGGLPELRRVIVGYGNTIVMEPDLESALGRIFGGRSARRRSATFTGVKESNPRVRSLAAEARQAFESGQRALRQGDWEEYGKAQEKLERLIRDLEAASR